MRPFGVDGARYTAGFGGELALAALGGGGDAPPRGGPRPGRPGGSMIGQAAGVSQRGCRLWSWSTPRRLAERGFPVASGFRAGCGGGGLVVHPLRPCRNPRLLGFQPAAFPRRLRSRG